MPGADTHLLRLREIKAFLRALDRSSPAPGVELTLIGGAAVALLCEDGERQTDDIDTLASDALAPWTTDCHVADGAWLVFPRSGPGLSKAGGMALSVAGGPPARRYLFRVAGGVAGE